MKAVPTFARPVAVFLAMASLAAAQDNQLDGNKTLFTVMAAMNAAGFDAQADSPSNSPLRKAVTDEVLRRKPASLEELRRFRLRQRFDDPALELRMYAGYALLVKGAPNFELRMLRNELPPDVALMDELGPVFAKFYQEAGIEDLWQRSQPAIEQMLEQYHTPVIEMVQRVNGYLRIPSGSGYLGKTFQVVADPLGPPNQIQLHTFYDNYYLLVTPSAEPQVKDVRRAYLHFLLDPMATQAANEFKPSRALGEYVAAAPLLGSDFKTDYLLLATRSLIRAIEARLDLPAGPRRTAAIQTAMKEGFILTEHFADQLAIYEKQDAAMRLFLPEAAKAIDLAKEEQRLARIEFTEKSVDRMARPAPAAAPKDDRPPMVKLLDEAEDLYTARKLEEARAMYLEAAEKAPEKPLQAKAYYGLARIAALSRNPELAEQLFERTLELEPEDAVKAWAHVYLGRLNEAAGEGDLARKAYTEALQVRGISQAARQAAEAGLQKLGQKN